MPPQAGLCLIKNSSGFLSQRRDPFNVLSSSRDEKISLPVMVVLLRAVPDISIVSPMDQCSIICNIIMKSANSHPYVDDYGPFIDSFFPESERTVERFIPLHNVTSDWWVVRNNSLFNTQWIQCSYPISGSYGPTPRYLFYVLVLIALHKRKTAWIVTAALGSVMTYSATAAIHALVLVSIRTKLIPSDIADWMVVLVSGTAGSSGEFDGTGNNPLWLPVIPMA